VNPRLKQHPLGFYEIAEKPTVDELQKYYAEKYYQNAEGSYEHEYTQDELKYFRIRLEQGHATLRAVHSQVNKIRGGYAMAYFKKHGNIIKGLGFSSVGVESKKPECLDALITGDLFELLHSEINSVRRYDIVWLQNVLEHVLDPVNLMETLRISYFDNNSLYNIARKTGCEVAELLGDFPIDWSLYHPSSNYVMDSSAGKNAHWARMQLENLFAEKPVGDVLELCRAMAKVGSGRDLTAFIRPVADSV
jgi:hypothetical protein